MVSETWQRDFQDVLGRMARARRNVEVGLQQLDELAAELEHLRSNPEEPVVLVRISNGPPVYVFHTADAQYQCGHYRKGYPSNFRPMLRSKAERLGYSACPFCRFVRAVPDAIRPATTPRG